MNIAERKVVTLKLGAVSKATGGSLKIAHKGARGIDARYAFYRRGSPFAWTGSYTLQEWDDYMSKNNLEKRLTISKNKGKLFRINLRSGEDNVCS